MAQDLQGAKIAILVSNEGAEEAEYAQPRQALLDAGAEAATIAPKPGTVQAFQHLDKGGTYPVDATVAEADPGDYDALVLPGGVANPDQLRMDPQAVAFVKAFFDAGKPVAVICHGPWTMVEADVVRGRTLTSWPSLQTDIRNAGGTWVDREVQVCEAGPNVVVSSRKPDDLPAFCTAMIEQVAAARSTATTSR